MRTTTTTLTLATIFSLTLGACSTSMPGGNDSEPDSGMTMTPPPTPRGDADAGLIDAAKNLGRFIGIWSPTSGTFTMTCNGSTSTGQVTDNVTWAMGATSDLVQALGGSSCVLRANVMAGTATIPSAQTCRVSGVDPSSGDSITDRYEFTAYTFVLSADALTANENLSGTLTETDDTLGLSVNCTFTQTASYQKQ
jgi:hypothetical protein